MTEATRELLWPNFLIIGAAKSGTTALYHQMSQHPDVFMSPVKEPAFFAHQDGELRYNGPGDESAKSRIATTVEDYLANFANVSEEVAIGEASVVYLYDPDSPANIHRKLPEVRLIAMLRNPVHRAYSNYLDNVRHGFEKETFAGALDSETSRAEAGWSWYWRYRDLGFYGRQLQRYLDRFDRDQIRIYFYDDYESDPVVIVRDIFEFIGVDPGFRPDLSSRHNVSGLRRSTGFDSLIRRPNILKSMITAITSQRARRRIARSHLFQRILTQRPELPEDVGSKLRRDYESDIRMLEQITGRDLSGWL